MAMRHWGGEITPEVHDSPPLELPTGKALPPTMEELVAKYMHAHLAAQAEENNHPETWEEADDFEEEDPDVLDFTRYELALAQEEEPMKRLQTPSETPQEAPQEEIAPKEGPSPSVQEEAPSAASE